MDTTGELVERVSRHRAEQMGSLSDDAYTELVSAVRASPDKFIDRPDDQAFRIICQAVATNYINPDDDLLDDEQYRTLRERRLSALREAASRAIALDDGCVDARLISVLATDAAPSPVLERLLELDHELEAGGSVPVPPSGDAWDDAFARPRLRVKAAAAQLCLGTAHFREAARLCAETMALAPTDDLGCRFTLALTYARLEDEEALDELDARFERRGNAWMHLSRALLMYKLDRVPAARRALRGYANLCEGGAYALARPAYVERYIPDRPTFRPGSFEEAVLANHEADPIVMDTPDFVGWAMGECGLAEAARSFAEGYGLDW